MLDISTILWLIAGFGFLFVVGCPAGCRHGCQPDRVVPRRTGRATGPSGVQETDVPRFAVEHLDALRPAAS